MDKADKKLVTIIDFHYQLEECIGQGGFATVWRAKDLHSNIFVAVKIPLDRTEKTCLQVENEAWVM